MVEVEIQYSGKLSQAVINHGFSTLPTPLHGATFLKRTKGTDKTTVEIGYSFTSVASSGHPSKGLIGELQCATFGEADFFECVFDQSLCECDNQGTYVDCLCNWISLNAIVTKVTRCASCQSGASTNVECISNYEKGKTNIIFSSTIEVDWNCTLTCGLISTKLQLQGQLVDEPRFSPPSLTYAQRENRA